MHQPRPSRRPPRPRIRCPWLHGGSRGAAGDRAVRRPVDGGTGDTALWTAPSGDLRQERGTPPGKGTAPVGGTTGAVSAPSSGGGGAGALARSTSKRERADLIFTPPGARRQTERP